MFLILDWYGWVINYHLYHLGKNGGRWCIHWCSLSSQTTCIMLCLRNLDVRNYNMVSFTISTWFSNIWGLSHSIFLQDLSRNDSTFWFCFFSVAFFAWMTLHPVHVVYPLHLCASCDAVSCCWTIWLFVVLCGCC